MMDTTNDGNKIRGVAAPDRTTQKGATQPGAARDVQHLPVGRRHVWIMFVASAEQVVANVLTAVLGAMIPLMKLFYMSTTGTEPGPFAEGCLAASGLAGIMAGAPLIGHIADNRGNLGLFRLCGVLILIGGLGAWLIEGSLWLTIGFIFLAGLGVGGGYSLDDVYLSELMPEGKKVMLIGVAKTYSAFGLCWGAIAACGVVRLFPEVNAWRTSMILVAALGLMTVLIRIRWWDTPRWLLLHGRKKEALCAARHFFGQDVTLSPPPSEPVKKVAFASMFRGTTLWKVILTSVPWALEGIACFGVSMFMPMLLMAIGLHIGNPHSTGIPRIEDSLLLTGIISFFLTPGFAIGLTVLRRMRHTFMMTAGFVISATAVVALLLTYLLHWPMWIGIAALVVYELALGAGPALITFVLPAEVYTVAQRGTGSGIAASVGKAGAVLGIFFFPMIMKGGGAAGVLGFCIVVLYLGALVTAVAARKVRRGEAADAKEAAH